MTKYTPIESRRWVRDDGATASLYGAVPWTSETERLRWELRTIGWTVRNERDGTIGVGRQPWVTRSEAQAFADKWSA